MLSFSTYRGFSLWSARNPEEIRLEEATSEAAIF